MEKREQEKDGCILINMLSNEAMNCVKPVKLIVNFYATLRQLVGTRQVEFSLPEGSTLRQLIAEMVRRYPGLNDEFFDENGMLQSHIHFFINGRDSAFLDGSLDSLLHPGDVISVFPPVGGG